MRIAFVQTDVHGDVVVDVFFDNSSYGKVVVTMKKKLRREGGSRRSTMSTLLSRLDQVSLRDFCAPISIDNRTTHRTVCQENFGKHDGPGSAARVTGARNGRRTEQEGD